MNRFHLGALFALLLALQFAPGLGMRDAMAVVPTTACKVASYNSYPAECSPAAAYADCQTVVAYFNEPANHKAGTTPYCNSLAAPAGKYSWQAVYVSPFGTNSVYQYFNAGGACSVGVWDPVNNVCFDSAACLAKPPIGDQGTSNLSVSATRCDGGCKFEYRGQSEQITTNDGTPIKIGFGGQFKPTGASCAVGDPATDPVDRAQPDQNCAPAGDGQTFCVKKDGRQCYSATSGRQICWRPGETGEKTDGAMLQVRVAGGEPGPATTQAPYGAMYEPAAAGVKIMAEYGWFRDEGPSSDATVTTTTQNHTTTNGVNAGGSSPDQGENSDGTPGPSTGGQGGEGSGEGSGAGPQFDVDGADTGLGEGPADSTGLWSGGEGASLDMGGFLASRSCPPPPTFTLAGVSRTIDTSALCDLGAVIAALVILMSLAHAAWILGES